MRKQHRKFLLIFALYLGLHNGYIALWNTQQTKPVQVFPYRIALYPDLDRTALEQGIPIEDESTLEKLLEDLLS